MKENNNIISQDLKDYSNNPIIPKSYPDLIEQVDKVIKKYKNQLEQLRPKKEFQENNNKYIYEKIKEEPNKYSESQANDHNYNFEYKISNNNNSNVLKNDLDYDLKNDNIKLGSALTLEKSKVVQLLNLLKIKEGEINNLKGQIEKFEVKVNEIENKYQDIINKLEKQHSLRLNDLQNNFSYEKNKLKMDYEEAKKIEINTNQYNNDLNNNKKILILFFDLFNNNVELFKKTEILQGQGKNFYIGEKNFTEENAFLATDCFNKLINKLVQDNKDLFNELVRLKGEMEDNRIITGQNNNFILQENNSLRKIIQNLTRENNILKEEKSFTNNKIIPNMNNAQIQNREINENQQIHYGCNHCNSDFYKSSNMEISPLERVKIKILNLEKQIKNQIYS